MILAAVKGSNERGTRAAREGEQQTGHCNNIGRAPRPADALSQATPAQ